MSWGLSSERVFCISSNGTPSKIGPGKYDTGVHMGNTKPMKAPFNASSQPPKDPLSKNPGPGQYEAKPISETRPYANVFHSRSKRQLYPKSQTPAPTMYATLKDWVPEPPPIPHTKPVPENRPITGFVGQNNVVGFEQSEETGEWLPIKKLERDQSALGPGTYDPVLPGRENPPVSLGMDATRNLYGTPPQYPGPGAYSPIQRDTRIPIAISQKAEEKITSSVRKIYSGPRVWTSLADETSAVFRFHGERPLFPRVEKTPDPGVYDLSLPRKKELGDHSGFGVRADRKGYGPVSDTPGPGAYNVTAGRWIKKGKHPVRQAVDRAPPPEDTVPGPGSYNPELPGSRARARPNSVFMSRASRAGTDATDPPGPGNYSPKTMDGYGKLPMKIRQSRFEKVGNWIEMSKKTTPSPDKYETSPETAHGRTIPRDARFKSEKRGKTPGPGTYEVKHETLYRKSHNSSIPRMCDA